MAYSAERYQKYKDSIKAAQKRYYEKNRESYLVRQKKYDDENREKIKERHREKKYYRKTRVQSTDGETQTETE